MKRKRKRKEKEKKNKEKKKRKEEEENVVDEEYLSTGGHIVHSSKGQYVSSKRSQERTLYRHDEVFIAHTVVRAEHAKLIPQFFPVRRLTTLPKGEEQRADGQSLVSV